MSLERECDKAGARAEKLPCTVAAGRRSCWSVWRGRAAAGWRGKLVPLAFAIPPASLYCPLPGKSSKDHSKTNAAGRLRPASTKPNREGWIRARRQNGSHWQCGCQEPWASRFPTSARQRLPRLLPHAAQCSRRGRVCGKGVASRLGKI